MGNRDRSTIGLNYKASDCKQVCSGQTHTYVMLLADRGFANHHFGKCSRSQRTLGSDYYGLKFRVEELFLDSKSGSFQL